MQVLVRACDLDFQVTQTAHPAVDGRHLVGNHRGVGHQADIRLEQSLVLLHPGGKRWRADLLFAFEKELDVVSQFSACEQILESLDVHEKLAFVVVCAPPPDGILAGCGIRPYHGLEGVCAPEFQRLRRLHVIMPVHQHGLGLRVDDLAAENDRIAVGGEHLGLVGTGLHQQHGESFRAAAHVVLVRGLGADGRNPQYGKQFFEKPFLVLLDVFFHKYRSK